MDRSNRWTPILFLWGAFCLAYMARQSLYSTFPLLRGELGFSEAQLGLTTTVFGWVYGVANVIGGKVADRFGKRQLIVGSLAAWSLALAITGLASSPGTLLAGRSLMALAQSFYIPAAVALIASLHSTSTRSRAITLHGTGQGSGVVAGGYYGAVVSESIGWRGMLWVLAGATALYALVLRFALRADAAAVPASGKRPGGGGLLDLFRIPTYSLICLCSVAVGANVWMLYTWLPDLLRERFALPMAKASLIATSSIEVASFAGLFAGAFLGDWLSRRHPAGRLYLMIGGLGLACVCFFGIAAGGTLLEVRLATSAYAICKGFYTANYVACIFDLVAENARGVAVGSVNMISAFGGSLSPYLLGALKPEYGTVTIFGCMSVFGILCAATLGIAGLRTFHKDREKQHNSC